MTPTELSIIGMFIAFAAGVVSCMRFTTPNRLFSIPVVVSSVALVCTGLVYVLPGPSGVRFLFGQNMVIDALTTFHLILVNVLFLITSIYATGYFKNEHLTIPYIRRYCMLWQTFQALLVIVLLSNNIGIMWVALEATTIVSSFLIVRESAPLSVEAMWKYLLICSVGIVFAFMGTILTLAAASQLEGVDAPYLFNQLHAHAGLIEPKLMLFAFIFIVVGFGTKAGLSPMHTWLPDAHSQAPTPVSAVFSGVMLNVALYCILRYLPIAEAALGRDGQAHAILLLFGFMSLFFAAVFIPVQNDMKRFLAYCSVEHLGIISIGLGIGGIGTFAALLHTTGHSLSKIVAFFSSGYIGEHYKTRDMRKLSGAVEQLPLWGTGFFVGVLVLIGVAPSVLFISEFLIVKEAFFQHRYVVVGALITGVMIIFLSGLKFAMHVSFGTHDKREPLSHTFPVRIIDRVIVTGCLIIALLLGLWIPVSFSELLKSAGTAIENGIGL
ncbi:MAG: proton-conducting transporter membrane subunit [Pseudomonadota bacterium]